MFRITPYNRNQAVRVNNYSNLSNVFDNFFNDDFWNNSSLNTVMAKSFKVDVKETENAFELTAELPGVKKDEVNITYKDNYLTIKTEIKRDEETKEEGYIRKERSLSSMERTFLVKNIQGDKINAKLENGLLIVHVPKEEIIDNSFNVTID